MARTPKLAERPRPPRVALVFEQGSGNVRLAMMGIYAYIDREGPWETVHIEARRWVQKGVQKGVQKDLQAMTWVDGVITIGSFPERHWVLQQKRWGAVGCFGELGSVPHVASVDESAVARLALDTFADLGFRRVGFMAYSPTLREEAFLAEARRRGLEAHTFPHRDRLLRDYWSRRHEVYADWLSDLPKGIGVLAHSASMAQDLTAAATLVGVHVPEEVAVLTCGADEEECLMSRPALSTIGVNAKKVGYESARRLGQLLAGNAPERPVFVPPTGVTHRTSTDILAVADPLLARAIRLLRDGATEEITVDDVLKVVPLSRNQLEYGLRQTLGRSPYEEIMRVRIEKARRLLRETTLDLATIAVHSGLGTSSNFCKVFKRKTGQTPGQYRMDLNACPRHPR